MLDWKNIGSYKNKIHPLGSDRMKVKKFTFDSATLSSLPKYVPFLSSLYYQFVATSSTLLLNPETRRSFLILSPIFHLQQGSVNSTTEIITLWHTSLVRNHHSPPNMLQPANFFSHLYFSLSHPFLTKKSDNLSKE